MNGNNEFLTTLPPIQLLSDQLYNSKRIRVSMLRLDLLHPVLSGNKIFKLHYFLKDAKTSIEKKVITFGGAYSNHLAATAFACGKEDLEAIGIVRGEKPKTLSHTLKYCLQHGMKLEFISRDAFKKIHSVEFARNLISTHGFHTLIPEGGFSIAGAKGAAHILELSDLTAFTHICCPVGTATTLAGLIYNCKQETIIQGFSVLKNMSDIEQRLKILEIPSGKKYSIVHDYHFGGYAKKSGELINFINLFYKGNKIPLDFVYTGKMMFGVIDHARKNLYPSGANILCIHTGGLQGNHSLPAETFIF